MTAQLTYYPDDNPGILRKRCGRGFTYFASDGSRITCPTERKRITSIAVPPAYQDVWIAPFSHAHLWATGRDDKNRKQYIYNPAWTAQQSETKFATLADLAPALPSLRHWIARALRGDPVDQNTQVAAALALIDRAAMRPGNSAYTAQSGSYGATTLRDKHLQLNGDEITLSYTAKGGVSVTKTLHAPRLSQVLEETRNLPGAQLFTFEDGDRNFVPLTSDHLIEVLRSRVGEQITPKTLRTWHGTLTAFNTLRAAPESSATELARAAADHLHNTPAIARSSYIHPDVLAATETSQMRDEITAVNDAATKPHHAKVLRTGEAALARFLGASL